MDIPPGALGTVVERRRCRGQYGTRQLPGHLRNRWHHGPRKCGIQQRHRRPLHLGAPFYATGNKIYSNDIGIRLSGTNSEGRLANNLVYANHSGGISLESLWYEFERQIVNNTIYQPHSYAIRVSDNSRNVQLRNNIMSVFDGDALNVAADSQVNWESDYNLFQVSAESTLGMWQDRPVDELQSWYWTTGQDEHSLSAVPSYVNPLGADGILGFDPSPLGPAVILDDTGEGFAQTGNWGLGTSSGYESTYRIANIGGGDQTATWSFFDLIPGAYYHVAVTHPHSTAYTGDAPFAVLAQDQLVSQVRVSQKSIPSDFEDAGVGWTTLGVFRATGTTMQVQLSDKARIRVRYCRCGANSKSGRQRWR